MASRPSPMSSDRHYQEEGRGAVLVPEEDFVHADIPQLKGLRFRYLALKEHGKPPFTDVFRSALSGGRPWGGAGARGGFRPCRHPPVEGIEVPLPGTEGTWQAALHRCLQIGIIRRKAVGRCWCPRRISSMPTSPS